MPSTRFAGFIVAAAAFIGFAGGAQAFPDRPVTMVVPFAAGGNTDIIARLLAEGMSQTLGQRVLVENQGGGGGLLGSARVAAAAPDGHTILMGTVSTHVIGPMISRSPPYDPARAFAPVSLVATAPLVVIAHPSVQARTLGELAALARARPGTLNFGSPGIGTVGHLAGEWLGTLAGGALTHVPYRGSGPAMNDLLAGTLQLMVENVPPAVAHVQAGSLRALAVTSPTRAAGLPDVPTSAEAGLPGFLAYSWNLVFAPAGTPAPVVARLNQAIVTALADAGLRRRMVELSTDVIGGTSAEAVAFLAQETAKWRPVVEASGVRVD